MKTRLIAILGGAGVGKSFVINNKIREDPFFGIRTATTGVAAVNMGNISGAYEPTTINSALRYFNSEDLLRKFNLGKLTLPLKLIGEKYRNIIIDEISLANAATLDLIVLAIKKYNLEFKKDLGLYLSGDIAQLPTVKGKPFFMAKCWNEFKIEYLTEVKRQTNLEFINALSHIRKGEAEQAIDWFSENVKFGNKIKTSFRGTTFFSTNNEVDIHNKKCLASLMGESKTYYSKLKGKAAPPWKNLPDKVELKPGCIIQLLYNDSNYGFANGDLAIVNELWDNAIYISLLRKKKDFLLRPRTIKNYTLTNYGYKKKEPIGTLDLLHVRLAYALTVFKAQGLTLDNVQINLRGRDSNFMAKQSGMLYTALSRVRTPEGLYLVGSPKDLVRCCYVNPNYLQWIK